MRSVIVELTHCRGQRLPARQSSPLLRGEIRTHLMQTKAGHYQVAALVDGVPTHAPLAELYNVELWGMGHGTLHLRGLEKVLLAGKEAFVLQGWIITDIRDHYSQGDPSKWPPGTFAESRAERDAETLQRP